MNIHLQYLPIPQSLNGRTGLRHASRVKPALRPPRLMDISSLVSEASAGQSREQKGDPVLHRISLHVFPKTVLCQVFSSVFYTHRRGRFFAGVEDDQGCVIRVIKLLVPYYHHDGGVGKYSDLDVACLESWHTQQQEKFESLPRCLLDGGAVSLTMVKMKTVCARNLDRVNGSQRVVSE